MLPWHRDPHLVYDGAIPSGLRNRGVFAPPRPAAAIGRITFKPHVIVDRMATVMLDREQLTGCCTFRDLLSSGLSHDEIVANADAAKREAARRLAAREAA